MPGVEDETHRPSSSASAEHVAVPVGWDAVAEALRHGPRGAFFVAGVSTALLFVGWLAFYFLLFMPRGSVG
ncbi:MAG TPA: hypothetical protein VII14_04495 [Xanthobacteraceae bacterium]|jgi:hypothetical protein